MNLINTSTKNTLECNCRKEYEWPIEGNCKAKNIIYKSFTSSRRVP